MTERSLHTVRNFIWSSLTQGFSIIMGFLVRSLIIRKLGTEYLGLNSLFISVVGSLNIAELGFDSVFLFCLYEPMAEKDYSKINAIISVYRKIYFFIGLFVLFAGIVLSFFLKNIINSDVPDGINIYVIYLLYLLQSVIGYFFFSYRRCLLFASQNNEILDRIGLIQYIFLYFVQIISLCIFKNYYCFTAILPVTQLLSCICVYISTKKMFPQIRCEGKLEKDFIKDFLKRVFASFFIKIRTASRCYIDTIVITHFMGLLITAKYNVYLTVYSVPSILLMIIINCVKNSIGNYCTQKSLEKCEYVISVFLFWITYFSILFSICYFCLIQDFIELWVGKEMELSFSTQLAFSLLCFSTGISYSVETIKELLGLQWYNRYTPLIEMITNVILDVLLIKIFGACGVVIATAFCICFITFSSDSYVVFKFYLQKNVFLFYLKIFFCFIVGCFVGYLTYNLCLCFHFKLLLLTFIVKSIVCCLFSNIILVAIFYKTKTGKKSICEIKCLFNNGGKYQINI